MRVAAVTALVFGALAWGSPAQDDRPATEVDANGDPFTAGSLNFDPAKVRVHVGDVVRWTNTDEFVPHTSTEDHGLWQLSGTYGSPGPFQGYGPGESVERPFEAGTHHYYCEVHPDDMRAVVAVPVTLKRRSGRRVRVTWSLGAPAEGLVFDVQRRLNGGPWRTFVKGTAKRRTTSKRGPRGTRLEFRARLRSHHEPDKATGWSPPARIRG